MSQNEQEYYTEDTQFTDAGARAKAERLGCTVEYSDDYTLQLDLDTPEARRFFEEQLEMLDDLGLVDVKHITKRPSRHGNQHVTLKLAEPLALRERILLQAVLGSDRKREMLSYAGLLHGQENPVLFFRPKEG